MSLLMFVTLSVQAPIQINVVALVGARFPQASGAAQAVQSIAVFGFGALGAVLCGFLHSQVGCDALAACVVTMAFASLGLSGSVLLAARSPTRPPSFRD
jgi:hypothetical protein